MEMLCMFSMRTGRNCPRGHAVNFCELQQVALTELFTRQDGNNALQF